MASSVEISPLLNPSTTMLLGSGVEAQMKVPTPSCLLNSSPSKIEELKQKLKISHSNELKVKLLCGETTVHFPVENNLSTIKDLKEYLCEGTGGISPFDLLAVANGKELKDEMLINDHVNGQLHILTRSNAKSIISMPVHCRESNGTVTNTSIKIAVNSRVFNLQSQLYKYKLIPLKPGCQRLMMGARQLSDERAFIGNYVLFAAATQANRKKKALKMASSHIVSASCPTLNIIQTIDMKREVKISLYLGNSRKSIEVDYEIGLPISQLQETLVRRFLCPSDLGSLDFFIIPSSGPNTGVIGKDDVHLDKSKTLFDYGVLSTTKTIAMRACILVNGTAPAAPAPVSNEHIVDFGTLFSCLGAMSSIASSLTSAVDMPPNEMQGASTSSALASNDSVPAEVTGPLASNATSAVSATSLANAKKRPISSGDKATKDMFRGMKKGFLSSETKLNKGNKISKKE